jgi:lysophospholipase L1-like esterase
MKIKIFLVFVSALFALIGIDFVCSIYIPKKQLNLMWPLLPGVESYWLSDKNVIFISNSVRDLLYKPADPSQTEIVTIGDSFVQGNMVAQKDSFPSKLQDYFQNDAKNYPVINLGVGGYCPDQEFRLFDEYMKHGNRPKVVVWAFYANDIYENQTQATYDLDQNGDLIPLDSRNNWIYKRQVFYDAIPFDRHIKNNSLLLNQILFMFELQKTTPKLKEYANNRNQWSIDKITKEVELMDKLADQYGFTVYYVLIYPQAYYMPNNPETRWILGGTEIIYNILHSKNNFIPLDFSETQSSNSASVSGTQITVADRLFTDERDLQIKGNRHFNVQGYQLFAERVFDIINRISK